MSRKPKLETYKLFYEQIPVSKSAQGAAKAKSDSPKPKPNRPQLEEVADVLATDETDAT